MNALAFAVYVASGLITREALGLFAVIAPAILIPSLLGARLYTKFSETMFRRLVLVLLLISGLVLLASSVPQLASRV